MHDVTTILAVILATKFAVTASVHCCTVNRMFDITRFQNLLQESLKFVLPQTFLYWINPNTVLFPVVFLNLLGINYLFPESTGSVI